MNRLLVSASKSAASSFRNRHVGPSSAVHTLAARHFSDAADETKVGTVKTFSAKNLFGFIVPDGVDMRKHDNADLFFIHGNDIKTVEHEGGEKFFPMLERHQRVQFKAAPPDEGKESGRAYDLTLEGGDLVPPFLPGYLDKYIRIQKSRFGDDVFEIFSTSQDQRELETKIVAAYDKVRENIERQTAKVQRATELYGAKNESE